MIHRPDNSPWQPTTPRPEDWRDQGSCRGHQDPDLWYATAVEDHGARVEAAKKICGRCPVLAECLGWALDSREPWGIYGGLTAAQRAQLRGEKPLADPDTTAAPVPGGQGRQTGVPKDIEHGTYRGFKQHKRRGEDPCEDCIEARRVYSREAHRRMRARRKAAAA